jgi:hypothetical protein
LTKSTSTPWFLCRFQPAEAFAEAEPLFVEQERAIAADWDAGERVWRLMFERMRLVSDDPTEAPIKEFLIRLDGDTARLRYEPA